jgi:hypothetical protein
MSSLIEFPNVKYDDYVANPQMASDLKTTLVQVHHMISTIDGLQEYIILRAFELLSLRFNTSFPFLLIYRPGSRAQ